MKPQLLITGLVSVLLAGTLAKGQTALAPSLPVDAPWSATVGGVRARVKLVADVIEAGREVVFQIEVENISNKDAALALLEEENLSTELSFSDGHKVKITGLPC